MGALTTDSEIIDPFLRNGPPPVESQLASTFPVSAACTPCRVEETFSLYFNEKVYKFTMRDRILPEDPYLVYVKAQAFAIRRNEEYRGVPVARAVKDFLVKNTISI